MGEMSEQMRGIHDTAERIVRSTMLLAMFRDRSMTLSPDEKSAALEPLEEAIEATMGMLGECIAQASLLGANRVHQALHQAPGVDPYMLDEAVDHATRSTEDGDDG